MEGKDGETEPGGSCLSPLVPLHSGAVGLDFLLGLGKA